MTSDGGKNFEYDVNNRLVKVSNKATGAVIATYEYDADGRRTSKTTSTGTVKYFYDGDSTRVLYETDGNNTLLVRCIYDQNEQLVAMIKGSQTYFYHYNAHGDVVALTDLNGNVVAEYDYGSYGQPVATGSEGTVENSYRYAGYRWDSETGMYYLNARYYNPDLGRFITRDSFHGFEEDPLSFNQYNYARSNPIMYVDPTGYYWQNAFWNSKWFVGNLINAGIYALVAGPVSVFQRYARNLAAKYSSQGAAIIFADALKRKLLAKGVSWTIANWTGTAIKIGFTALLWATDPGGKLFDIIDSRDLTLITNILTCRIE